MKISETKIRKIIKNQLHLKRLEALSKRVLRESSESEPEEEAELGAATKAGYQPKLQGAKMPTSKSEAGTYMTKAVRGASGITSQEIPALIQFFDDMLQQFVDQNMTASKAKKVGKGIEIGKQRAGIREE